MKTIFYAKRGRRYYPVQEYDSELLDAMPAGAHLVVVKPGSVSMRYRINPDHASIMAAVQAHRDELCKVIRKATEWRFQDRRLTKKEQRARAAYIKEMGDDLMVMESASAHEVVDVFERRLIEMCGGKS